MIEDKQENIWLNDYPMLKETNQSNPFEVPEGYFTDSADFITARINLENLKEESAAFQIPSNYFHQLNDHIQSRIRLEHHISSPSEGFTVPDTYFDHLSNRILQNIETQSHTGGILQHLQKSNFYKYAAVACLAMVFAIGLYFSRQQGSNIQSQLSNIADTDIENYLNVNTDMYDTRMLMENQGLDPVFKVLTNEFSNDELNDYLTTLN